MNNLKQAADHILYDLGLAEILAKYGEIHPVGSYFMDAMAWNDLDIDMVSYDMTIERLYRLTGEILAGFSPVWYEAKREVTEDGRTVFFHGFEFYADDELWNVDIWFFDEETVRSAEEYCTKVKNALDADPEKKKATVCIKRELMKRGMYGFNQYTSMDVYRAVIDNGVMNV